MLTIIGTILGLLGSLMPELLKYFRLKEDHKHETEMARLQMDQLRLQGQIRLEEINAQADIEESKALYEAAEQKITGVRWIDAIVSLYSSSVRPTVTYLFIAFYGLVKYAQYHLYAGSVDLETGVIGSKWEVLKVMWNSEDTAALMTILAFWFGGRFTKYALERTGKK